MLTLACAVLVAQATPAPTAFGQAIVLPKADILPKLEALRQSHGLAFYVNGPLTVGLTDDQRQAYYPLGSMHQLLMTLATLRLVDKGLLSLDDSAAALVPDILEHDPFMPTITVRHLLSNTAGFAAIPDKHHLSRHAWANGSLKRYLIQIRSAGQMPFEDIVGWALLERVLERAAGKDLFEIYDQEIFSPLNIGPQPLQWPENITPSGEDIFRSVLKLEGSGALIAEVVRVLIRNRSGAGRYLSGDTYRLLTEEPSWRLHPLAPPRVLSLERDFVKGIASLKLKSPGYGPKLLAFPTMGVAFVSVNRDSRSPVIELGKKTAADLFPNGEGNPDADLVSALTEPKLLGGIYLNEGVPSADLTSRLGNISTKGTEVLRLPDGTISVTSQSDPFYGTAIFEKKAPYYYENQAYPEHPLVFSPKTAGGYFTFMGATYRYVGLLGDPNLVIYPVPFMLLILVSAVIYAPKRLWRKRSLNLSWHRLGLFAFTGVLFLLIGLYGELFWWPKAVYEMNAPWLVFAWRCVLNIGLMAILTIPLFTLSITKRKVVPPGVLGMAMNLHLVLLTAASLLLFFIMVAWGIAGELWPY